MNAVTGSAQRVWGIAMNTVREAIRNRVLGVLVLFAIALMAFSLALGELSLHEEVRIIKDLGLAGISVFGLVIALFLGVNLLSKELDRKTVYAIIPKPIARWEFLLGKYLGLVGTLVGLVALMSSVLALFVIAEGGQHGELMVRAEVLIAGELTLVIAVALLFSSFSSPYLSAMFTAALWVIGRNSAELEVFATKGLASHPVGRVLDVCVRIAPDFRMFYVSGANLDGEVVSVHSSFVTWAYVGHAMAYCGLYASVCVGVAFVLFSRRDLV
ncbi:MAG: ABC transporter permease [Nannocystaceae bacterium]